MKKNRIYFIAGILSYAIGLLCILIFKLNNALDLRLSKGVCMMISIVGIILIGFCIVFAYLYIKQIIRGSEELSRGEKDERNIMIRGRAAVNSFLVMTFIMLLLEMILLIMGELTAAVLLSIAMFLCVNVNTYMIMYYQKKY